jgi:hypothetical protein
MNGNSVKIDRDAFRAAIEKAGTNPSAFGIKIGFGANSIHNIIQRGSTRTSTFNYLCMMLNADPDDLIAKEPDIVPAPQIGEISGDDMAKIRLNVATMMFEQKRHNEEVERRLEILTNIANDMIKLWEGEQ